MVDVHFTTQFIISWTFVVAAAFVRRACYRSLGPMFTFDLSIKKDHNLVQTGPYSIVRHPGYAAFFLMNCGIMLVHIGVGSGGDKFFPSLLRFIYNFFVFSTSAFTFYLFERRAKAEDEVLREKFGIEWMAWATRVPHRFIPLIW